MINRSCTSNFEDVDRAQVNWNAFVRNNLLLQLLSCEPAEFYALCSRKCYRTHQLMSEPSLEMPIYGYVFPTLVVVVIITNALIVAVLSRRNMVWYI